MPVRGIRGATVVEKDEPDQILSATHELLIAIHDANPSLNPGDIASVIFSMTEDLHSVYPARAARDMGWEQVPLFCTVEIPVPDSLKMCIRILIHWNTDMAQNAVNHVYLGKAAQLRPDLVDRK